MPASFPNSIFAPSVKAPGHTIAAAHVNDLQDEVVAIETGYRTGTAPLHSSNSTLASLFVSSNATIAEALGVNRAPSTDASLNVDRTEAAASTATNARAIQGDAFAEGGAGGVLTGGVFNARTSTASTWNPSGGQLFGFAVEASLSRPSTAEASVLGGNIQAKLLAGSSGFGEVAGLEINTVSEVANGYRCGLLVSAVPRNSTDTTENVPSTGFVDAAIGIAAKNYGARFTDGILIHTVNSTGFRFPIQSSGAILRVELDGSTGSVHKGIDLSTSGLAISSNAFASPGFAVSGLGNITVTANGPTLALVDNAGSSQSAFSLRVDDGALLIRDVTNATDRLTIDVGVIVGAPTGGDKGAGTLNAVGVYDDNVLLTDYVFDLAYDGRTVHDVPDWFPGLASLDETAAVTRSERRLPWMPTRADFEQERSLGGMISRLWAGQEQQQLYIQALEARIAELEKTARG